MDDAAASRALRARRREAAELLHGIFADVATDRNLVDELIAERRAEASADEATRRPPPHHGAT